MMKRKQSNNIVTIGRLSVKYRQQTKI